MGSTQNQHALSSRNTKTPLYDEFFLRQKKQIALDNFFLERYDKKAKGNCFALASLFDKYRKEK